MILKKLNVIYYLIYTLMILFTIVGYFLNFYGFLEQFYSIKSINTFVPYFYLAITAFCLVFGFLLFELRKNKIRAIENEWEQANKYVKIAGVRLYLTGIALLTGIIVFYTTFQQTTLYGIALSAILLIMYKPTENKISNDLDRNTDN